MDNAVADASTARVSATQGPAYVTSVFQPRYGLAVTDPGWSPTDETSSKTSFIHQATVGGTLDVAQISTVYSNPCSEGGDSLPQINTTQDLVNALQALSSCT